MKGFLTKIGVLEKEPTQVIICDPGQSAADALAEKEAAKTAVVVNVAEAPVDTDNIRAAIKKILVEDPELGLLFSYVESTNNLFRITDPDIKCLTAVDIMGIAPADLVSSANKFKDSLYKADKAIIAKYNSSVSESYKSLGDDLKTLIERKVDLTAQLEKVLSDIDSNKAAVEELDKESMKVTNDVDAAVTELKNLYTPTITHLTTLLTKDSNNVK